MPCLCVAACLAKSFASWCSIQGTPSICDDSLSGVSANWLLVPRALAEPRSSRVQSAPISWRWCGHVRTSESEVCSDRGSQQYKAKIKIIFWLAREALYMYIGPWPLRPQKYHIHLGSILRTYPNYSWRHRQTSGLAHTSVRPTINTIKWKTKNLHVFSEGFLGTCQGLPTSFMQSFFRMWVQYRRSRFAP